MLSVDAETVEDWWPGPTDIMRERPVDKTLFMIVDERTTDHKALFTNFCLSLEWPNGMGRRFVERILQYDDLIVNTCAMFFKDEVEIEIAVEGKRGVTFVLFVYDTNTGEILSFQCAGMELPKTPPPIKDFRPVFSKSEEEEADNALPF